MRTPRLVGKLLRVPRLVWDGRFDTIARTLAAERLVRLIGVGRTYRIARWIGFKRLASWAVSHRLPSEIVPAKGEQHEAAPSKSATAEKKAA